MASLPTQLLTLFAQNGSKNTIPQSGTIADVNASYQLGFPPLTMQPAGGTPPNGMDMNGILYAITQVLQMAQAGAFYPYNSSFATAIGGYPLGARVLASDNKSLWINLLANNTSNPDAGGAGWQLQSTDPVNAQIGDIRMWHRPTLPTNAILCDGSLITSDDYPELYTAWYGTFQPGQSFYLPNLTNGYYPKGYGPNTQALGTQQLGALPNITGEMGAIEDSGVYAAGAFYVEDTNNKLGSGDSDNNNDTIHFDASRSNPIYGRNNTTTVETNSVALNFIVYFQ